MRLATRALAGCLLREATDLRSERLARLVLVSAAEAGLAAVNLRLTGMALRRLTVETVAHLVPMDRLAVKAA